MALERRTYTGPSSQAGLVAVRVCVMVQAWSAMLSRRVAVVSVEAAGVSHGGAATGADLGGSSKYSKRTGLTFLIQLKEMGGVGRSVSWLVCGAAAAGGLRRNRPAHDMGVTIRRGNANELGGIGKISKEGYFFFVGRLPPLKLGCLEIGVSPL
ncbi:Exportin 1 C terminal [Echinococcus multilocularis]|uniref:Exportin 1 C terminal n=1 Tax=Echinococcus multilocularis TaxID=6211 RepID=A0A068Y7C9_ECHMU|nr:Exportin 1 C terminal [Echinococcus multilocularis]